MAKKDSKVCISWATDLLKAHVRLINTTADTLAADITMCIQDMQHSLDAMDHAEHSDVAQQKADLGKHIKQLLSSMQAQDVLRQQMLVLQDGLDALGAAQAPQHGEADAWRARTLEAITNRYVMRQQHEVHARFFPDWPVDMAKDDSEIFF